MRLKTVPVKRVLAAYDSLKFSQFHPLIMNSDVICKSLKSEAVGEDSGSKAKPHGSLM